MQKRIQDYFGLINMQYGCKQILNYQYCFIKKSNIFCITGNALLRRLVRIGVLDESKMKLDFVLGLRVEDFLERRLQTQVFKLGLAKSIHHARVLIRQRHIRYLTQ